MNSRKNREIGCNALTVWKSRQKYDHDFTENGTFFPSNQSKIELLANFTNKRPFED